MTLEGLEAREYTDPSCGNDWMHLGCTVNAENSNFTVFAEFGGGVCLAFNFFVDLGTGGEQSRIIEDFFGGIRSKQRFPRGYDVECRRSSRYLLSVSACWRRTQRLLTSIKQGNSCTDSLPRMSLENLRHVRKRGFPFNSVAEITVRTHCAQVAT